MPFFFELDRNTGGHYLQTLEKFILFLCIGFSVERFNIWNEGTAVHVGDQRRWDFETVLALPILQDSANGAFGGTQSRVQAVHVLLLAVRHLFDTASDFKAAGLVVSAVAAGDEFLEFALVWKPGFQVVFLCGCVVKSARDDGYDAVRETQALEEVFRMADHFVEHFPRLFWISQDKLFDLFKLVDAENTPGILAMSTGFLAETGRVTGISLKNHQVSTIHPSTALVVNTYLIGSCSEGFSNHSLAWKAEIGCSEVAIRYLSSPSPET